MAEQQYNIDDIINNAIGDKPVNVQKAFDNIVVQRAADIIAGKREEVARQFGVVPVSDEEEIEDDILDDFTDEEIDDILNQDEDDSGDPSVEDNEDPVEWPDDEDWPEDETDVSSTETDEEEYEDDEDTEEK